MYTLSQIQRRVDVLKRKYAKELAIYRLRQLAESISNDWAVAIAEDRELPQPLQIVRRIADAGVRSDFFSLLHRYIERCRQEAKIPDPLEIVLSLLPWARLERYSSLLRYDLPAAEPT